MGIFITLITVMPSVIQGVLQVIREVKKDGNKIERSEVKDAVCKGLHECAVKHEV